MQTAGTGRPANTVPLLPGTPIYCWPLHGGAMLYAPGCLAVASAGQAPGLIETLSRPPGPAARQMPVAAALRRAATRALATAAEGAAREYRPVCLTLYLTQACTLSCTYCYSDAGPASTPVRLTPREVAAGASVVAANCAAAGRPLTVVFHGGGEPTADEPLLWRALATTRQAAHEAGCGLFAYIATNGCIDETLAERLADAFDLIGLSCDGPPDIQNRQRPMAGGAPTATMVERTARILRRAGRPFQVRTTVTPESATRQAEVADYIAGELAPTEMRFEPVYRGGRQLAEVRTDTPSDAVEAFAHGYLEALTVSERHGIALRFSGVRLDEMHGPYCQTTRQVLNLVPGESGCVATACFKQSTARSAQADGVAIGSVSDTGRLDIDGRRLATLTRGLSRMPARCDDCFNRFHCAGECPDRCRLDPPEPEPGFRCLLQQRLAYDLLLRRAETMLSTHARDLERDGACFAACPG